MTDILAGRNLAVLRRFALSKVLLGFDYDGTLAPIVTRPEQAVMRAVTQGLLGELARLYPCVVISGRSQGDALKRLRGVPIHEVIGNHGMEPWPAMQTFAWAASSWRPLLEVELAGLPGVWVEDKVFSVAIHYRESPEKERARERILEAARTLGDVRLLGGKDVINVLPSGAPHKGLALERARARLRCDSAIYVGDDETDEDVFELDRSQHLLTIRVGRNRSSAAAYFIDDQQRVDDLLRMLIAIRTEAGIAQPPWGLS